MGNGNDGIRLGPRKKEISLIKQKLVRAVSFPEQSVESIDQVLERTAEDINKKYPNLNLKTNRKLKAIAGISANMTAKWREFSDKEITSMAKIEKYMEKKEILESLLPASCSKGFVISLLAPGTLLLPLK